MAKGILVVRPTSKYDDDVDDVGIVGRYQFPAMYLKAVKEMLDDWVVFYEPRRSGGSQTYGGAGKLTRIYPSPEGKGLYYAKIDDYIEFDHKVPFIGADGYQETALRDLPSRKKVGQFLQQKSVRVIPPSDFSAIIRFGLSEILDPSNAKRLHIEQEDLPADLPEPPDSQARIIVETLQKRTFREGSFRGRVLNAYKDTCAMTGICMINGGGNPEVQACHIRPVENEGPDHIRNGIALSGTVHWMFERGLVSISDNFEILVSHNRVPSELKTLLGPELKKIKLPDALSDRPHPKFLQWHRENKFGKCDDIKLSPS